MASNRLITRATQRRGQGGDQEGASRARSRKSLGSPRRTSATFVIETLLLLVCLLAAIAACIIAISISFDAEERAYESEQASAMASDLAEQFSADPANCPRSMLEGSFFAEMTVSIGGQSEVGTLYVADIKVYHGNEQMASLSTGRYIASEETDEETIEAIKAGTGTGTGESPSPASREEAGSDEG